VLFYFGELHASFSIFAQKTPNKVLRLLGYMRWKAKVYANNAPVGLQLKELGKKGQ